MLVLNIGIVNSMVIQYFDITTYGTDFARTGKLVIWLTMVQLCQKTTTTTSNKQVNI